MTYERKKLLAIESNNSQEVLAFIDQIQLIKKNQSNFLIVKKTLLLLDERLNKTLSHSNQSERDIHRAIKICDELLKHKS